MPLLQVFLSGKIVVKNLGFSPQGNYCMSRPKPVVLAETTKEWRIEQVMLREEQYLLTYDNLLVTMKSWNSLHPDQHVKYMKNNWSDESRAKTICRKLNARYGTDKFGYIKIGSADYVNGQGNNSASQA